MPVDFKLIRCCQASTCVQQDIVKLKSKNRHYENYVGMYACRKKYQNDKYG